MLLCLDVWDMLDVNALLMLLYCDMLATFDEMRWDRGMLGLWYAMIDERIGFKMIDAMLIVRCMLVCACVSIECNVECAFNEIKT